MPGRTAGNAVVYILVAIALFAALAYAFTKSGKTSADSLSVAQAKTGATEIVNYGNLLTRAVDKMRRRGCSESQISFASSVDAYHNNPSAPGDFRCHIFRSEGANMQPGIAKSNWFNPGEEVMIYYTSSDAIQDLGTSCGNKSCSELSMNLWCIQKTLCDELNRQAGNAFTTIPSGNLYGCAFQGTFDCAGDNAGHLAFNSVNLRGKRSVCYFETGVGCYVYNHALLER